MAVTLLHTNAQSVLCFQAKPEKTRTIITVLNEDLYGSEVLEIYLESISSEIKAEKEQ